MPAKDFEKQIGELVPLLSQITDAIAKNVDLPAPLMTQLKNVHRKLDADMQTADMQTANRRANKNDAVLEVFESLIGVLDDLVKVAQRPIGSFSSTSTRF